MSNELIFRILTVAILAGVLSISTYFRARADRRGGAVVDPAGQRLVLMLRLYGLAALLPLFAYLINPDWVAWARFPVPDGLRWLAALAGVGLIPLAYWVFASIGDNISPTASARQEAQLVTHGPYRWVRHPLYTTGTGLIVVLVLVTGLWWLAAAALPALAVLVRRTSQEEVRLVEKFGDAYRAYMRRTGRFLPRLGGSAQ
jgi:protein-S-isoprenylcysteine O-methyltransferase Ste14